MNYRLIATAGAAGVLALAGATSAVAASDAHQGSHARSDVHAKQRNQARSHDSPTFVAPADSLRTLASKVNLRMGTAIIPQDLTTTGNEQIAQDQFSAVTPGNEMKWQVVEPQRGVFNWTGADNLVNFAEAHGQLVRGHTLMWHNQLPNWLTSGVSEQDSSGNCPAGSPSTCISDSQLKDLLHQHITTEVSRFRGRIWQWDVVNEMASDNGTGLNVTTDFWLQHLCQSDPTQACATNAIGDAFRWAHAADPNALLCYNDYNIAGEDGTNAKFDTAFQLVSTMLAQHVPISCVGDQGHLDLQFGFNPTMMTQDLQAYANLGLKVAITEADVRTFVETTDANQTPLDRLAPLAEANWYDGMLNACLAVRACIDFTVWGFEDGDSWVPGTFAGEGNADLYDVNLNPKPAFTQLQESLALSTGAPRRPNTMSFLRKFIDQRLPDILPTDNSG